jgi:hypothetical protein
MQMTPEVEQARRVLVTLCNLSLMSRRTLAKRLAEEGGGTDLTRLLSGRLQLKLGHVVALCKALDIHPLEFSWMVFGEPAEPSPFLKQIDTVLGILRL